ncbi:hypothetical protein MUK42_05990 [Musa troglodytarum]|uniref:Uncharacterized protein n=1 Tax=Musa troglodytarum TaxID=320322 RepID=A0A9E7HP31_9LILI|nr:hypothetical protein MUK42_05990 [Musa troglodytarum]
MAKVLDSKTVLHKGRAGALARQGSASASSDRHRRLHEVQDIFTGPKISVTTTTIHSSGVGTPKPAVDIEIKENQRTGDPEDRRREKRGRGREGKEEGYGRVQAFGVLDRLAVRGPLVGHFHRRGRRLARRVGGVSSDHRCLVFSEASSQGVCFVFASQVGAELRVPVLLLLRGRGQSGDGSHTAALHGDTVLRRSDSLLTALSGVAYVHKCEIDMEALAFKISGVVAWQ